MNEVRFTETPERKQEYENLERDLKAMEEESKKDIRQVYLRKLKEISTKKKKPTNVVNNERTD